MLHRYIGDRNFYRHVFGVAVPIIIQNAITSFVSLLDNIMVGQVGTVPMSGVSIVNGLLFVFQLCVFGAASGAGIFTAQFYGSQDQAGIRYTFRFKLLICAAIGVVGCGLFLNWGDRLIGLYLTGEGEAADAAGALDYGLRYLKVMLWGLPPFAIANAYASTLRETGETKVPMEAGIAAVVVNLVLNYVLIFGHFGAPAMGVEGAALATVISRFVELAILLIWSHTHYKQNPYLVGTYRSCYIPGSLLRSITVKGMPLLVNELLWSSGMAIMNQCYSTCGLDVVPAMNICSTLFNLSSVVFHSLGNTVGILMGQLLGSGASAGQVRDANRKLLALSIASGAFFASLMAAASGLFPLLYNTTTEVRHLAAQLILITAVIMPFESYINATYFTIRSGGQALVTLLFDSVYMWVAAVPLAFVLSRFTATPILLMYFLCQATNFIKCILGAVMLKRGKWIRNLTV